MPGLSLDPVVIPTLLTGLLMLTLATVLLVVDFNNVLHRVFGLLLVFQALLYAIAIVRYSLGSEWAVFTTGLMLYVQFPRIPLYLLFISLYPFRRGIGHWKHAWVGVVAVSVGALAWYMFDHSAHGVIGPRPEGWLATAGSNAYVEYGPLFPLFYAREFMAGLIAFILARDYLKSPHGSAGFSRLLVYAGFALNALFDGTLGVHDLVYMLQSDVGFPWFPFGWAQWIMPVVGLPLALGSLVYIHRASRAEKDSPALQEPRRFLYFVAPLPILSGVILGIPALESRLSDSLFFLVGIWGLSIPLLITYSLLRFQAFGADVKIKHSVAKVILIAIFAVVFFSVLEAVESLLGDRLGMWPNIVLAAGLALAAAPLQRFANRAADRVMPDTKAVHEQDPYERGEFYQGQYELVHEDGVVSAKDREMLDRLALSLRISKTQQKRLERGNNTLPRIEQYVDGHSADDTHSRWSRILSALVIAALFGAVGQGLESMFPADSFGFSLVSAAVITVFLGPLQSLMDRLIEPPSERKARRHRRNTYRHAVRAAFVDGNVTAKERTYLDRLQKELGLSQVERIQIHLRTARRVG